MKQTLKEFLNHPLKYHLDDIKQKNSNLHAVVRFFDPNVQITNELLKWAPIIVKDNMLIKDQLVTCGSKILENYIAPYTATCCQKLLDAWVQLIGYGNMDEFAMGSSTESSALGITKNIHGTDRVPGGSSWGSAVAVAADLCVAALGSDTGGSIRQPAAFCGVVGLKPTYGRVSRYGVQSMASSLDQVGTFTKTVEDAQILLEIIAWKDIHDGTSSERDDQQSWKQALIKSDLTWLRIAIPQEFMWEGLDTDIKNNVLEVIEICKQAGAKVTLIDFPNIMYALAVYYTIMPAEVSTNLARFDGMRYGLQHSTENIESIDAYYNQIRGEGFGEEVKRRIMIGTYVLSSSHYEGVYMRAKNVQAQIQSDFQDIFKNYDLILWPTTPEVAWKIWEKSDDPLKMYLSDIYTIPANLAGLPAISIPSGWKQIGNEKLPIGIQLMANMWREDQLFHGANILEKLLKFKA